LPIRVAKEKCAKRRVNISFSTKGEIGKRNNALQMSKEEYIGEKRPQKNSNQAEGNTHAKMRRLKQVERTG